MLVLGLTGNVAVVTGGSDGLGWATAMRLAAEQAQVAVGARGQDRLDATACAISASTGSLVSACAELITGTAVDN